MFLNILHSHCEPVIEMCGKNLIFLISTKKVEFKKEEKIFAILSLTLYGVETAYCHGLKLWAIVRNYHQRIAIALIYAEKTCTIYILLKRLKSVPTK